MASCLTRVAATPVWPVLAILLLLGGVVTLGAGTVNLAQIIQKYDELYDTATSFSSPVFIFTVTAACLVLFFELMIAYSVASNKLRLRGIHCCANWKTYNACNGAADMDEEPNRGLGRCCILYSHTILALAWLNTILAIAMTAMGVAMGTIILVGAGVCYLDLTYGTAPYTVTVSGPEIIAEAYSHFKSSPFSYTMSNVNMTAAWINATLCDDPSRTAATGLAAAVGTPIILLSQVRRVD